MRARHYVITEWSQPGSDGSVTIVAQDVLRLADDRLAQVPELSKGKLTGALAATGLAATLTPAGIGAIYPASGLCCIGREILGFTRSGDALAFWGRGQRGTVAAEHGSGDLVQACVAWSGLSVAAVLQDILLRAGIPSWFIDYAAWAAEADRWMGGYLVDRVIAKPAGATELIKSLLLTGCGIWWDDAAQMIRFRAERPIDLDEVAVALGDAGEIVEKTLTVQEEPGQRVSQVHVWYDLIDPTQSVTESANYRRAFVAATDSGAPEKYGTEQIRTIHLPWLRADFAAAAIAARMARRYRMAPLTIGAVIDGRLATSVAPGALGLVTTRALVDDRGLPEARQVQVLSVEEAVPGHRLNVVTTTFQFDGRYAFITPAGWPDYGAASDVQRRRGGFIVNAATLKFADGTGPYLIS
jgi:hypothetical protein